MPVLKADLSLCQGYANRVVVVAADDAFDIGDDGVVVLLRASFPESARSFAVLYATQDGTLAGAVTVNWPKAALTARRAVAAGTPLAKVAWTCLITGGYARSVSAT
jgi:hypothetical protein